MCEKITRKSKLKYNKSKLCFRLFRKILIYLALLQRFTKMPKTSGLRVKMITSRTFLIKTSFPICSRGLEMLLNIFLLIDLKSLEIF